MLYAWEADKPPVNTLVAPGTRVQDGWKLRTGHTGAAVTIVVAAREISRHQVWIELHIDGKLTMSAPMMLIDAQPVIYTMTTLRPGQENVLKIVDQTIGRTWEERIELINVEAPGGGEYELLVRTPDAELPLPE